MLVCPSNHRGLLLVNEMVTREGFTVTTASILSIYEEAMRLGGFCVVVTATEAIKLSNRYRGC